MADIDPREKSRQLWDEMAAGWQRRTDYMWERTRKVGEWMVERLDPQPGQTILDLAAGPGETGLVAARLVGSEGRLISTDFAPEMVEVARQRAAELGIDNADFRVEDAENLTLPDDAVDGILCRWGFMLMHDPDAAFRECRRVLKDGGRLVFSVWGAPERNPWVVVPGMTLVQLGYQPGGDPMGPGGMFSLAAHDHIRTALAAAGFGNVEVEEMDVDWNYPSFDEAWGFMTEVAGAIASLIKTLPAEEIERVKEGLREAFESYRADDGSYSIPGVTNNVVAS